MMKPAIPSSFVAVLAAVAFAAPLGHVAAQDYPRKSVRIVVPYAAGGYTDVIARQVGNGLQSALGQPFIIDNRPGAATAMGAEHVAAAPPDGYTLMMTSTGTTFSLTPLATPNLRYRYDQFAPVALVVRQPLMLVASPQFPSSNVKELVAYGKASPGKINWATQGLGGTSHLVGELFRALAGVDMLAIHYKGSAPANVDLMAGRADLHFDGIGTAIPNVTSKKLKGIAVTSEKRMAVVPDIPTFVEAGLDKMVAYSTYGILAPSGTPAAIINKLNEQINRWTKDNTVQLGRAGGEVNAMTPEQFGKMMIDDMELWRKVIAPLNLKFE